jgi:RNA polymerase sigma-70 factor (ECF subfamily)
METLGLLEDDSPTAEARRDAAWVARARAGDRDAFHALFTTYQRAVYAIAFRMLGNAEEAADVAQETFVRAWRQLKGLRAGETFARWIRIIVTNLCRDHLKRARPVTYSLDAAPPGTDAMTAWELPAPDLDGAGHLLHAEFRAALARAIGGLSADHRAVLVLHHLDDQPVDEIARILGLPIGTVKSRLGRARAALRDALAPYLKDG